MRLLTRALACSVVAHYSMQQLPFLPEVISPSGVVAGTDEVSRPVMWTARTGVRKLPVP